ncbi:MAG: hypothetical protein HYU53_05305 [Acidobacteria bacterium]|nr:hypothetical protein [Acidobacteriota bacterium]
MGRRGAYALRWLWLYVRRFKLASYRRLAALVRRAWSLGAAERGVLIGLFGLTAAAVAASSPAIVPPAIAGGALSAVHLALFVFAWSLVLAVAAAQSTPLALAVAGPWLAFYHVLASGAWNATPMAIVPVAWLGWIFLLVIHRTSSRTAALLWWLAAAAGLAYVSAGPSGLRRALGWQPVAARLLLGGMLFAAGVVALRTMRPAASRVTFAYAWVGALAASALTLGSAALKSWAPTVEWTAFVLIDAAAIVTLFWMWLGGRFAMGSLQLVDWTLRRGARLVAPRVAKLAAPAAIALVAFGEGLLAFRAGPPASAAAELQLVVLFGHLSASAIALARIGWCAARRQLTSTLALAALSWWAVAWLVLIGLQAGSLDVLSSGRSVERLAPYALAALAIGLALEFGSIKKAWASLPDERIRVHIALVSGIIACAVALSTIPGGQWGTTRALMALIGMVHIGAPLGVYASFRSRLQHAALGDMAAAAMFAAGYAAVLVVMAFDARHAVALTAALPVLVVALAVLRRSQPSTGRAGGALAGALFGGGAIAGWMMPYPPTLPFLPVPAWIALLRDWGQLGRALFSPQHLVLLASAWAIGAAAGGLACRGARGGDLQPGS